MDLSELLNTNVTSTSGKTAETIIREYLDSLEKEIDININYAEAKQKQYDLLTAKNTLDEKTLATREEDNRMQEMFLKTRYLQLLDKYNHIIDIYDQNKGKIKEMLQKLEDMKLE